MIPLTLAGIGDKVYVARLKGDDAMRQHLADLGFVNGAEVEVISTRDGNVIVSVKGSRLGLVKEMAAKVMVDFQK